MWSLVQNVLTFVRMCGKQAVITRLTKPASGVQIWTRAEKTQHHLKLMTMSEFHWHEISRKLTSSSSFLSGSAELSFLLKLLLLLSLLLLISEWNCLLSVLFRLLSVLGLLTDLSRVLPSIVKLAGSVQICRFIQNTLSLIFRNEIYIPDIFTTNMKPGLFVFASNQKPTTKATLDAFFLF